MHEAMYWEKAEDQKIQCYLCPHHCLIPPGKRGKCKVRINQDGTLYTENYEMVTSVALDPIEKKPLYHFYPGSRILSIGTFGCNLRCDFCQNWQISQERPPAQRLEVDHLPEVALRDESIGVAFTYNEPSIWYEYVLDGAKAVQEAGGKVALVTNGFISPEPLEELLPHVDALNIDLKSMDEEYYQKICGGKPGPVLESIRLAHEHQEVLLEVTHLLVPEQREPMEDLVKIRDFLTDLDPQIPLHVSRYFPQYRMAHAATEESLLKKAYEYLSEEMPFVYLGNYSLPEAENTLCPSCNAVVIKRLGYQIDASGLRGGSCAECGKPLPIVT